MPFKSQAQRAWFHKNRPDLVKEWEKGTKKRLPKRVKKAKKKSRR